MFFGLLNVNLAKLFLLWTAYLIKNRNNLKHKNLWKSKNKQPKRKKRMQIVIFLNLWENRIYVSTVSLQKKQSWDVKAVL